MVIGGPFNSGILATGSCPADGSTPRFDYAPAPADVIAKVARIEEVCGGTASRSRPPRCNFRGRIPPWRRVVAGMRSQGELDRDLALARVPIPREFWHELRGRSLVLRDAPLPE